MAPVPKRSEERVRRNKPNIPLVKIEAEGPVAKPHLGLDKPHKLVRDLYDSLNKSGQARYFEPSDWQLARVTLHILDEQLKSGRMNSQILATVFSNLSDLLVSEGARRRMRIEIDRVESADAEVVDIADVMLERQRGA